jgi:1-acyl-sn-glycerol-3-phosphate acyltransferase
VHEIPAHGPLLVVANHTAWMDPIWVAKVIPRRIIPLMTSRFYDRPVLRWIMIHIVQAIRVPMSRFKRETPEITEAINRLDRGDCVVIFPEGFMRRSEDKPLRHFGRGVWHILHERPQTPVVVCWIEGGWGSYFSYCKGPPTKNKRFDFWRRISIAVGAPQIMEPSLLADQRATRTHLMQLCLDARRYLGLEPLARVESIKEEAAEGETI